MIQPLKFIRTADAKHIPIRVLREMYRKVGTTVPDSFPDHEMYRGAGLNIRGIDGAGEFDPTPALRCDCGADRTTQPDQCLRCGDTNPPEYR